MARRKPSLGSHLEWNGKTIRVTVAVPRDLQKVLGTRLKRSLKTDSPALAERIKHGVIQELKAAIEEVRKSGGRQTSSLIDEALTWREDIERRRDDDLETMQLVLVDRAEEVEKRHGPEVAQEFYGVAVGRQTPLDSLLDTYLASAGLAPRSVDDARRSLKAFQDWCAAQALPRSIEATTRRVAGRFVSEYLIATKARKTAEKYLSFLSGYWKWLEPKGYATENPWTRQLEGIGGAARKRRNRRGSDGSSDKRPYTDDEARTLLYGIPDREGRGQGRTGDGLQRLRDIMWIGALSGMRLDEICRLRVRDCRDGWFDVNAHEAGKTDAACRRVPIHDRLKDVIARRSVGKTPAAYLIEDLPEPPKGSNRERSMPASKAYTRFRRAMGVDERIQGQRQSNVDFHSWRRWFIKKARDAGGNTLWTIADVVGHDTEDLPGGLTMGTYPGRASDASLRACVDSVQPPEAPGGANAPS